MKKLLSLVAVLAVAVLAFQAIANEPASSAQKMNQTNQSATAASASTNVTPPATPDSSVTAMQAVSPFPTPAGVKLMQSGNSQYWTTSSGMTLYTFAKDSAGKSSCTGDCAKNWPALAASSSDKPMGPFTIINGNQWAFNGKPLYTYAGDKNPGERNGAKIASWSIASFKPSPSQQPSH